MIKARIQRVLATDTSAAALALFAASLSLPFSGAGRLSVDRALTGDR